MSAKLTTALIAARRKFMPAVKNKVNSHLKNSYVDLASVIEATDDALAENGLVVVQPTEIDEQGRVYLLTKLLHTSGEEVTGRYLLKPAKEDPQGYGAAMTYARRYCLMALLGIAPEDDDGNAASQQPKQSTGTSKPTPLESLVAKAKAKGIVNGQLLAGVKKYYPNITSLEQLTPEQCHEIGRKLDAAAQ